MGTVSPTEGQKLDEYKGCQPPPPGPAVNCHPDTVVSYQNKTLLITKYSISTLYEEDRTNDETTR